MMANIEQNEIEHERRFLVDRDNIPKENSIKTDFIEQFYYLNFTVNSDRKSGNIILSGKTYLIKFPKEIHSDIDLEKLSFRQRIVNHTEKNIFTIKGPKIDGKGFELEWDAVENLPIHSYDNDLSTIRKTRFYIPYQDCMLEVDQFIGKMEPLSIIEVENPPVNFIAPKWAGEEITNIKNMSNFNLSMK